MASRKKLWFRLLAAIALLVAAGLGCSRNIGDDCSVNLDCSTQGDRICDTAQFEGYCTVEGCGINTCPEEAVCVRFFPTKFLSKPCDPATEDAVNIAPDKVTNDCRGDEVCLSSGHCALFSLERRFCMLKCEDNSDCRSGYECRSTGTAGAEALRDRNDPNLRVTKFCGERPQVQSATQQ
ncbi:MAG: hypothetical protein KC503_01960 [Myxococcales bacterium]|nr:hypothetical protein [Myxococcales bacterium]